MLLIIFQPTLPTTASLQSIFQRRHQLEPIGYFCGKDQKFIFADPLGQTLSSYKHLQSRITSNFNVNTVYELLRNQPIQKQNSILCGLFCIYIAHIIFSGQKLVKMNDIDLLRFALHMMF